MRLRVSFRRFWPGFDPSAFFLPLVQGAVGEAPERVDAGSACDIEFVSVFIGEESRSSLPFRVGRRLRRMWDQPSPDSFPYAVPSPKARISIWYTGECIRPPVGEWDRTWSFEPDSGPARNTYAPLWLMKFPELLAPVRVDRAAENLLGRELRLAEVTGPRVGEAVDRPRFACMFTSRLDPARSVLVRVLSSVGEVDVFGRATGRVVDSKLDTASQYRFMICPENALYPGYVTEKAFDAWGAGCIPIWSGLDVHGDLSTEALLNCAAEPSLDHLVARVARLEADPGLMRHMGGAPLLARWPSLDTLRGDLLSLLDEA